MTLQYLKHIMSSIYTTLYVLVLLSTSTSTSEKTDQWYLATFIMIAEYLLDSTPTFS